MGRWTIGKTLSFCIGGLALTTVALIAASVYTQRKISSDLERLATRTAPALKESEELSYVVEGIGSALRDSVVAAVKQDTATIERDLDEIHSLENEFDAHVTALGRDTDLPEAQALARDCQKIIAELRDKSREVADLVRAMQAEKAANGIAPVETLVQKCQDTANRISDLQAQDLTRATLAAKSDERRGMMLLSAFGLAAFFTLGVVGYVTRRVVRVLIQGISALKAGNERVSAAAAQVSGTAQTLSHGASEQAASLEETSATMETMASMTRRTDDNSHRAAGFMASMERAVDHSHAGLRDMTEAMGRIRESSTRIAKIITTIDDIAFQTNILALNAAVEAARAGEAGMGFAVVADEVRNLAQRSAQAAKDTTALIQEAIGNAEEGHGKVDVVSQSIAEISGNVGQVKNLVIDVSQACEQQSQGVEQVARAIAEMEQVTQSTAASAEESAAASEELNAQAAATLAEVARLEALVSSDAIPPQPDAVSLPIEMPAAMPLPELSRPAQPAYRGPERRSPTSKGARFRAGASFSGRPAGGPSSGSDTRVSNL